MAAGNGALPVTAPKGIEWEVSLRSTEFLYRERGRTPEEALTNLVAAMELGIAHATEGVAAQQRRLDGITAYLAEIPSFVSTDR